MPKSKLTIDLGWVAVTLKRPKSWNDGWVLDYLGRYFSFEQGFRDRWDVYEGPTRTEWGPGGYQTLSTAVSKVVICIHAEAGEAHQTGGQRAWVTRQNNLADVVKRRMEKVRAAKEAKQVMKRGRKDAPWRF